MSVDQEMHHIRNEPQHGAIGSSTASITSTDESRYHLRSCSLSNWKYLARFLVLLQFLVAVDSKDSHRNVEVHKVINHSWKKTEENHYVPKIFRRARKSRRRRMTTSRYRNRGHEILGRTRVHEIVQRKASVDWTAGSGNSLAQPIYLTWKPQNGPTRTEPIYVNWVNPDQGSKWGTSSNTGDVQPIYINWTPVGIKNQWGAIYPTPTQVYPPSPVNIPTPPYLNPIYCPPSSFAPVPTTPTVSPRPEAPSTPIPSSVKCQMNADERDFQITAKIISVSGPEPPLTDGTPQFAARQFILNFDDSYLCPDAPNLVQRYVLAVLYYSTTGFSPAEGGSTWAKCGANRFTSPCPGDEERVKNREPILDVAQAMLLLEDSESQSQQISTKKLRQPKTATGQNSPAAALSAEEEQEIENIIAMLFEDRRRQLQNGAALVFTDPSLEIGTKRWLSPVSECQWFGITCIPNLTSNVLSEDSGTVVKIALGTYQPQHLHFIKIVIPDLDSSEFKIIQ